MPKKRKGEPTKLSALDQIARLLALIAVKDLDKEDAARRLLSLGFDGPQIGGILGVGPNFANVAKSRVSKG